MAARTISLSFAALLVAAAAVSAPPARAWDSVCYVPPLSQFPSPYLSQEEKERQDQKQWREKVESYLCQINEHLRMIELSSNHLH